MVRNSIFTLLVLFSVHYTASMEKQSKKLIRGLELLQKYINKEKSPQIKNAIFLVELVSHKKITDLTESDIVSDDTLRTALKQLTGYSKQDTILFFKDWLKVYNQNQDKYILEKDMLQNAGGRNISFINESNIINNNKRLRLTLNYIGQADYYSDLHTQCLQQHSPAYCAPLFDLYMDTTKNMLDFEEEQVPYMIRWWQS